MKEKDALTQKKENLWLAFKDSLVKVMKEAPTAWKGPDKTSYRFEEAILRDSYKPVMWGIGCVFFSFLSFRLGASKWWRRMRNVAPSPKQQEKQVYTSSIERKQQEQKEALEKALSIPTDLALSLLIGTSVGVFLTDTAKLQSDFERIPLVPGKSLVSKHSCGPIMEAHHCLTREELDSDASLEMFSNFVTNCRKRQQYEKTLRQREKQLNTTKDSDNDEPVSIPLPGVPTW